MNHLIHMRPHRYQSLYTFAIFILAYLTFIEWAGADNRISPSIQTTEFPGFQLSDTGKLTATQISHYEYQTTDGKILVIETCSQAENLDMSLIPEFEYFRFRLLLV